MTESNIGTTTYKDMLKQGQLFGPLPALPEKDRNDLGYLLDPNWHDLPSFNDYFCCTAILPWRIRYTFDYNATAAGNKNMRTRVAGNLQVNQAIRANLAQRILVGQQQINFLSTLPRDCDNPQACNSDGEMQKAVDHITNLQLRDKFWAEVLDLEIKMSQTALMRIFVAGQAKEVLKLRFDGKLESKHDYAGYASAGRAELRKRYAQYQDLRDEMVMLMTRIEKLLQSSQACSFDIWERHRNELWDIWGDDSIHEY